MTTISRQPADLSDPVEPVPTGRSAWQTLRPLLVRLHFYAGVLVAPFLFVAAATGFLFALTPQLDRWTYGQELRVAQVGDQRRPVDEQVAAARAAHPEGGIAAVVVAEDPEATTRVILNVENLGENQRTVFVDPYTAQVRGSLVTWFDSTPLTAWFDEFHRTLHLGDNGALYSEIAASWLWVVALGGLLLWIGRRRRKRRLRRTLLPDLSAQGVRRTMSWHGALGVWIVLGLLTLSATGLTWSDHAGARFTALRSAISAETPMLDTSLGSTVDGGDSGHAGHAEGGAPSTAGSTGWDRAMQAGLRVGLDGPIRLTPGADGGAWTVAEADTVWPVRQDQVAVHPESGAVTSSLAWADWPVIAKLSTLGINVHMGILFGLANQIVLASLALGLLCMIVWGYRMWWQRRPTARGVGRPPAPGGWRRLPLTVLIPAAAVVAAIGWALPLLGISLLGFFAVDLVRAGLVRFRRRAV